MEKLSVRIKPPLMELIPSYLRRRREDLIQFRMLLEGRDFQAIQQLGHKLSGNAATFGFKTLSQLGTDLEDAADHRDVTRIEELLSSLGEHLEAIEVLPLAI